MPDVPRAHGDLLGAVAVAVEAGLADQDLGRAPERLGELAHRAAHRLEALVRDRGGGDGDPGRRAVLAEDRRARLRPLAGGDAGVGRADRRRHDVLPVRRRVAQAGERRLHLGLVAPVAEGAQALDLLALGGLVERGSVGALAERRGLALLCSS
jgi:hypothetical protein